MKYSSVLFTLLAFIKASTNTTTLNTLQSNQIDRGRQGPIATECQFKNKITKVTTEKAYYDLMDDCNKAYTNQLIKDTTQRYTATLQKEIIDIRETLLKYKNNHQSKYLIRNSATNNSSEPRTTVEKLCDFDSKMKVVRKLEDYTKILGECSKAYTQLLGENESHVFVLNAQFVTIQDKVAKAKEDFVRLDLGSENPIVIPNGQTVMERCDFVNRLKKIKKKKDFLIIHALCDKAYSELLNNDQTRLIELNAQFIDVQAKMQVAKEEFAKTHPFSYKEIDNSVLGANDAIKVYDNNLGLVESSTYTGLYSSFTRVG